MSAAILVTVSGCGDGNTESKDDKSLQVAIVLPGSVTDEGFNADGQRAGKLLTDQLGAKVKLAEATPVPNAPDVMRQFGSQGYDLVIAWGGQFAEASETAAKESPKTDFLNVSSKVSNGKNLTGLDLAVEQWQYVAGYAMGKITKTGVLGFVGGQCFPSTGATVNATREGAEAAYPGVKFISAFTGDFEDAGKAQQATQAMLDQKVDVLTGDLNNAYLGVIKAAQGASNVPVFTEWADNHEVAPDVIAASVLKSHAPFVLKLVKMRQEGKLEPKAYRFDLASGSGDAISTTDLLPDAVVNDVNKLQKQITSGELKIKRNEKCPG